MYPERGGGIMSFMMWMKVFGDLCCYFSFLAAMPSLFTIASPILPTALFLSFGVFWKAACQENGRFYRLQNLGFLCPILYAAVYVRSMAAAVSALPACCYVSILLIRGDLQLRYYEYRTFFRNIMILWIGTFLILFLWKSMVDTMGRGAEIYYWEMLTYGVYSMVIGVILLRGLRLGVEKNRSLVFRQMAELAAAVCGISAGAYLIRMAGPGFVALLRAAGILVMYPVGWLFSLVHFDPPKELVQETLAIEETVEEFGPVDYAFEESAFTRALAAISEKLEVLGTIPWMSVLRTVGFLVFLGILAWLFFRSLARAQEEGGQETREGIAAPKARSERHRRSGRKENRQQIRQIYREYLRLCRRKGVEITPDMTSSEILTDWEKETKDGSDAEALRELYILARYDKKTEITETQVRTAHAILDQLKTQTGTR